MSEQANLVIGYKGSSLSSGSVIIEQEEWEVKVGKVSRIDLLNAISANIFGTDEPDIDCGLNEDGASYSSIVYVYVTPGDLNFNTGITNGEILSSSVEDYEVSETLKFSLNDNQSFSYIPENSVEINWEGNVYDPTGTSIPPPITTIDSEGVSVVDKVYGDATVKYKVKRYGFEINVPAREEANGSAFESVFYVNWDGGVELLVLNAPPNAEDNYANQTDCKGGSIVEINPDEGEEPTVPQLPYVSGDDKSVTLDYCDDF